MSRLKRSIIEFPAHHLLIILFFLLEGINEFYPNVTIAESLKLFGIFFTAAVALFFIGRLFSKDRAKSVLISFLGIYVILYCRTIYQYYGKALPGDQRISNTHFFIVLGLFMILITILILRSTTTASKKFSRFLNILFSILILLTSIGIGYKILTPGKQLTLLTQDIAGMNQPMFAKPNIYLLLFDEYQGDDGLKEFYGTTNPGPSPMLRQKGFFVVPHSQSNYNYTFYSVPSLMNMSYLNFSDGKLDFDLPRVISSLRTMKEENRFTSFLQQQGYTLINHSFLQMGNIPSPHRTLFVPHDGFTAIYSRTFPGWAQEDLLHFIPSNIVQKFSHTEFYQIYEYNKEVIAATEMTINERSSGPKFVYSHLLIPHPPMLTDSNGNLKNIRETMFENNLASVSLAASYTSYIKYANRILGKMVTDIQKQDPAATIIFASDHGLRSYPDRQQYIFNNQCAVYIPGSKYEGFYDTLSLVNLLRLVLNNACGQKIPLLPDSHHLAK